MCIYGPNGESLNAMHISAHYETPLNGSPKCRLSWWTNAHGESSCSQCKLTNVVPVLQLSHNVSFSVRLYLPVGQQIVISRKFWRNFLETYDFVQNGKHSFLCFKPSWSELLNTQYKTPTSSFLYTLGKVCESVTRDLW